MGREENNLIQVPSRYIIKLVIKEIYSDQLMLCVVVVIISFVVTTYAYWYSCNLQNVLLHVLSTIVNCFRYNAMIAKPVYICTFVRDRLIIYHIRCVHWCSKIRLFGCVLFDTNSFGNTDFKASKRRDEMHHDSSRRCLG